jgi:hypothetical protein
MRLPSTSFSLFMAIILMMLAVWGVPGYAKLVLFVPAMLGAGWAFFKLRRSAGGEPD